MSWFFKLLDTAGVNQAGVDASNQVKVALNQTASLAGYVRNADKTGVAAQYSDHGRQKMGMEGMLFYDPVDGAVLNTNIWITQATGAMTSAISSGFILLNSTAITTAAAAYNISSIRYMPFLSHYPLYFHLKAKTPNVPQANATIELGMGTVTGVAAPTDGVFFRWASDGTFRCVLNNAGTEVTATVTAPTANDVHTFAIIYTHNSAVFEIDGSIVATVSAATGTSSLTSTTRLQNFARIYNGGSAPVTAPQLFVAEWNVAQMDVNWGKSWDEQLASIARGSYISPVTTFLQTANHANSTSPASATLSNTAAGYTTLGGRYQFAAPAGAATDFALFGFQVPTGYQLVITGVSISAMNTGAAVATTATILDWFLAVNASAISLATAEAGGTAWAYRRIPLGMQGFIVGAGIGTPANDIVRAFDAPVVVDSGRFCVIGVQVPVGTATASQIIRGDVMVNGFFE